MRVENEEGLGESTVMDLGCGSWRMLRVTGRMIWREFKDEDGREVGTARRCASQVARGRPSFSATQRRHLRGSSVAGSARPRAAASTRGATPLTARDDVGCLRWWWQVAGGGYSH